ncbi:MAG: D-isomer specific 2-hydroxyacid dehydrogenase family protein [Clostridium beijerinckii]|jgi:D-lactate dehydrogenase|uniref:D-isomer specific 2-hydroxyacid dehydrogenase family protein n=1 Tax=Clostridium beijerinckii TaxID=1520 RepID=UPI00242DE0FD|nr:D-isomer specific 2-hydroxyacid dehydrogenase family protein [Clostridium beijerinckii]MCI1581634.1 D-isomer specific 2-hydroxyacid dehydrogenase family protein [Clostridium beijerinckii]MCI1586078.1 D-isomer specific 2-hydroxyacid dehydrogenase family protein [Clostridium beijerinckii]MCI1625212.1 D-isomer specific 2-hydroxyacid dehydrogenase family protein [Clostridium beijerinckii]MDG5852342.1 D-isomer specific 2-hydroxyacid dehydrogenase family protein [Clostridium beijerinckii]
MRILAYSHRRDETQYFEEFSKKYNVEVVLCNEEPSLETAPLAKGFDCISIITTNINSELVGKFHELGVKFISTRTIGYDHIDLKKAKELGVRVGNVTYSPNSVADYTIMLILMAVRKVKLIMERSNVQDFSLRGIQGKELPNLTIGVIGTGKIGRTVIKHLSGFGCKILAHDIYENDEVKSNAKYVELDNLFKYSDIITLHMPATDDNYHIINKKAIKLMKDGVFIINTARGSLINTNDLIHGIESKKIGGAALDVIEQESNIYYSDLKGETLKNRNLAILKSFPNVIITPHAAFYTDQAVSDMIENSIKSCILFSENKENPWEIDI